eukprot:7156445-Prymnesium_polylepis.1
MIPEVGGNAGLVPAHAALTPRDGAEALVNPIRAEGRQTLVPRAAVTEAVIVRKLQQKAICNRLSSRRAIQRQILREHRALDTIQAGVAETRTSAALCEGDR